MGNLALGDLVRVRRLRVPMDAASFDPLAARLHLERLLAPVEPRAHWLSPSAILCIRRLSDPRPGTLRLHSGDLRPPAAWERDLLGLVEEKARRAASPVRGPVPPDAEAVLFADRAELLACLIGDAANGGEVAWWWRSLLGDVDLRRAAAEALREAPQYLPAALARAAVAGRAAPFVAALENHVAAGLIRALIDSFGLGALARHVATILETVARVERPMTVAVDEPAPPPAHRGAVSVADQPLSSRPLPIPPEELAGLWGTRRLLLSAALALHRAPHRVHDEDFVRALVRDATDGTGPSPGPDAGRSTLARDTTDPFMEWPALAAAQGVPASLSGQLPSVPVNAASDCVRAAPQALDEAARSDVDAPPAADSLSPSTSIRAPAPVEKEAASAEVAATDAAAPVHQPVIGSALAHSDELPARSLPVGALVRTGLGGLLHLVNAALALELYPDFTRPLDRGLDARGLPIWDFVALFGAALLGETPDDPVWSLLARLAGRGDHEPPGARFLPPTSHEWRTPASWLVPFGDALPVAQTPPGSWTDWMVEYLRARLLRAMGLADGALLAPLLFARRARVHVGEAHLDVVFALADLPIEVRLAGLDRDPGFLPTAGYHLAFHFE